MEYLSRLMQKASNSPGFQYRPSCKSLKITHIMFAEDLIIFYKADPYSLQLIFQALKEFYECAGLKTNLQKSQIVFRGCAQELKNKCLHISGFQEGTLPFNYLEVPITAN